MTFTGDVLRSSDGLPIEISYSFTYQLNQNVDDVYRFYLDFGSKDRAEQDVFGFIAQKTVRDVASRFEAFDYFSQREVINEAMQEQLDTELSTLYCNITTFQITNMEIPSDFVTVIEQTQVAIQEIEIAEYEQEKVIIAAEGLVGVETTLANITILTANATAQSLLVGVTAATDALYNRTVEAADALKYMKDSWSLSNEEVLSYMHMAALKESSVPSLHMGLEYPY